MTDTTVTPAANDPVAKFELPHLEGEQSFDCSGIPAETRLDFLKAAVRAYVANRINSKFNKHEKDPKVAAWAAYHAAMKADPLQSTVAKPEGDEPAALTATDAATARDAAYKDLREGNVKRQTGESKTREPKDPLIALVTKAVERKVFDSKHAEDKTYKYIAARKEVGGDGVAYLKAVIEAKVAQGVDRAALEKAMETDFMTPARLMLGQGAKKKEGTLSLL